MLRRCLIPSILVPLLWGSVPGIAGGLKVGMSRVDITPGEPVELAGYGSRKELSTGIHDPLYARSVVFESEGNRVILVSIDGIGFYDGTAGVFAEALQQELGIDPESVFLCAIHSHSSPKVGIDKEKTHPSNLAYTRFLRQQLIKVVSKAIEQLAPASIGLGTGSSPVGVNRRETRPDGSVQLGRNPDGIHDREVLVLRLRNQADQDLGLVFDYATHATSLGPRNLTVSGDLIGIAEQYVESNTGVGTIAAALVGASGDIDPWYRVLPAFDSSDGWVPEPVLLGQLLGTEVVRVFREIGEFDSEALVGSERIILELPGKTRGEQFPTDEDSGTNGPKVEVQLIAGRVGDAGFLGINAEVLTEVGLAIKAGSPFRHTFIITHCNGAAGYLPPREVYKEGGYEVVTSPFAPGSAEIVEKEAVKLLHRVYAGTSSEAVTESGRHISIDLGGASPQGSGNDQ